jgi:beta-N-acetylhexosaminidase
VDLALVETVAAEIVAGLGDGRLSHVRLEEAASRVAALASVAGRPASRAGRPASAPVTDAALGYAAARRAVRVEGALDDLSGPLIVQVQTGSSIAEGRVPWGLAPHLHGTELVRVVAADVTPEALAAQAGSRPIVVVGRHLHRAPATRTLIEALAAGHTVGVVEMGWPSSWRPAGVRAFVTTYGASHANGRAAAEALGLTG